jgi:hypothetical protein
VRYEIPTVGELPWWAKEGFLFTYGQYVKEGTVRASEYVDKILRGVIERTRR